MCPEEGQRCLSTDNISTTDRDTTVKHAARLKTDAGSYLCENLSALKDAEPESNQLAKLILYVI